MSSNPHRRNSSNLSSASSTAAAAAAASSSSHPARPLPQDDITWLDFLRTAGGTVPADTRSRQQTLVPERSDSADRKRRHTGSEPERRGYPYNPYNPAGSVISSHASISSRAPPGSTRAAPIDLITPPRPSRSPYDNTVHSSRPIGIGLGTNRGTSDIALPRWQPDGDVDRCPVCSNPFSLLFRRHHCRKCGRVVCANCSPHRITIPRQYIVQPPNSYYEDESNPSDSPLRPNPALGGGEVVRVCNPCVPDPWTPHTTSLPPAPNRMPTPQAPPPHPSTHRSDPYQQSGRDLRMQSQPQHGLGFGGDPPWERQSRYSNATRSRSHSQQQSANIPPWQRSDMLHSAILSASQESSHQQDPHRQSRRYSQNEHEVGQRVARVPTISSTTNAGNVLPRTIPRPLHPPPPPPPPRREVAEEDECPVCGSEMPPGESVRESHIQECIASRFSSTPSQSSQSAPPAAEAAVPPPPAAPSTSMTSSSASPPVPEGSRPRATSYRPRGMALYRATEKDCETEDGEPQECVICFEEFQPGDEMGRMECLCKFHRLCIRQWWDTKGTGSCPTHQLHD